MDRVLEKWIVLHALHVLDKLRALEKLREAARQTHAVT